MRGYKLFRQDRNGGLHALYILAKETLPIGEWIPAKEGEKTPDGKVKKTGGGTLAYRPGWHICPDVPYETHIGKKGPNGKITFLPNDLVWAEVEYSDAVNYQAEADSNGKGWDACLKKVPVNGYYSFKTNNQMYGKWVIAGAMRIIRTISDEEVNTLCAKVGLNPLPREVA